MRNRDRAEYTRSFYALVIQNPSYDSMNVGERNLQMLANAGSFLSLPLSIGIVGVVVKEEVLGSGTALFLFPVVVALTIAVFWWIGKAWNAFDPPEPRQIPRNPVESHPIAKLGTRS